MARTLASTVIVRHPVTMRVEALRKGTLLPDWAEGLVSEERLEPADAPEVASVGDGTGVDGAPPVAEPADDSAAGEGPGAASPGAAAAGDDGSAAAPTSSLLPNPPTPDRPHGNAGRDAWAAYAEALGLDVPADATKGDIKRLIGG